MNLHVRGNWCQKVFRFGYSPAYNCDQNTFVATWLDYRLMDTAIVYISVCILNLCFNHSQLFLVKSDTGWCVRNMVYTILLSVFVKDLTNFYTINCMQLCIHSLTSLYE